MTLIPSAAVRKMADIKKLHQYQEALH